MKRLYLIGGTMGIGKTTVCRLLKKRLPAAVFLDGDWCWDADPFQVTEETKNMVLDNITHILGNFLRCTAYENVIFCWVMHEQGIIDEILRRIDLQDCEVKQISLICSPEELTERLTRDIAQNVRQPDILERSLQRIPCYEKLSGFRLDVSGLTPEETAARLTKL